MLLRYLLRCLPALLVLALALAVGPAGGTALFAAADESEWDTDEPELEYCAPEPDYCEPESSEPVPPCYAGESSLSPEDEDLVGCERNIFVDLLPGGDDPLVYAIHTQKPTGSCTSSITLKLNIKRVGTNPVHYTVAVARFDGGLSKWEFKDAPFVVGGTGGLAPFEVTLSPASKYLNADGEIMFFVLGLAQPDPLGNGDYGNRHNPAGVKIDEVIVTCP